MTTAADPAPLEIKPLRLIDTTFRDGNQSLLGGHLRAAEILPIARKMDDLGFLALEAFGGATFETWLRLGEEPWEYLRQLRAAVPNTPIQALIRGQNLVGEHNFADDVVELFIRHAAQCGVDVFRIFDPLNDIRNLEVAIAAARKAKRRVQGAICFAISPIHDLKLWCSLATQLAELEVDEVVIKDTSGLLTPQLAWELVTVLSKSTRLPVIVHSHCSTGMAPMSYMAAIEAGAYAIDTALSPLAWGNSQPATESMVAALAGGDYDTGLDLARLVEVKEELEVAKRRHQEHLSPFSDRVDSEILRYQLPGLMLQDIHRQLVEREAVEKLGAVLDEVIIVRRELGFPPLVAPIRQWLASQAVYNVLGESRYETIVKELKDYLRGLAGRPPKPPTKKLRQLVLGREEPITMRPAALLEPQVEEGRQNLQQRGLPADDGQLLEELLFPHLTAERRRNRAKAEKKEKPPSMPPPPEPQPVVEEVETLPVQGAEFEVEVEGELFTVRVSGTGLTVNAPPAGSTSNAAISPKKPAGGPGSILSPMQGLIVKLELAVGDQVESGDVVGVLEAMKMQNDIVAPKSGRVLEIYVKEGEVVGPNQPLLRIGE